MQNIQLKNSVQMPILAFGVCQIPSEQTAQAVGFSANFAKED